MHAQPTVRTQRVLILVLGVIGTGLVLHFFPPGHHRVYPVCVFHQITGLQCPGCGATRSVYHLLHGDWLLALRDNALFVIALPLLGLWFIRSFRPWLRGQPLGLPGFTPSGVVIALLLLMLFGVVRNLSFECCRRLVPPTLTEGL